MNQEPHILIVVNQPSESNHQAWKALKAILDDLKQTLQRTEHGEQLAEYVYQFPLPTALHIAIDFHARVLDAKLNLQMFYCASKIEECKKLSAKAPE